MECKIMCCAVVLTLDHLLTDDYTPSVKIAIGYTKSPILINAGPL